ncbi:4-fold beta flower protein [Aetokthonos hydrillicola]|jgi:hypothetical protein|uniref:4-fold beta flower protein n=1 Tax=Aetokthonos hydrillicola TaxID=1550245 RepID=UPI003B75CC11
MHWLWTWSGRCFGYKLENNLWTHDGRHVGRFWGDEIYDSRGYYLGEVKNENRLISNISKKNWRKSSYAPYSKRGAYARYANYAGYAMYAGHKDFPAL